MDGFHKVGAFGVLIAILFASLSPFARAADPSTPVSEEAGTVDSTWLGGGDHHFIRFGSDAAFGVLWGTNSTPNNIYLVAIKARYLGVADVENAAGGTIVRDRAVRIYTIYAMKLGAIVEFNDTNGDGVATYSRAHTDLNYTGYTGVEPLHKYASLRTGWTDSPVTRVNTSTSRTWTFSLTAWNLPYVSINGSSAAGALDLLRFTFHLTTTVVRVDNATVPKYTITVERQGLSWRITNASRDGTVTWSGDKLTYSVKWDQKIVGWDFDPSNANRALVIEVGAIVANRFPRDLGDWFDAAVVYRLREEGRLNWQNGTASGTANDTTGYRPAQRLRDNSAIEAGGDWTYIGRLTWASACTVDNATATMYAQVQGGIVGAIAHRNATYVGFALLIGFSFPGGNDIEHDPTVSSDAFEIVNAAPGSGGLLLVALMLVAVVVPFVLLAAVSRRRRRTQPPTSLPPEPPQVQ